MGKTPAKKSRRADAAWSRNVDAKGRLTLGEAFANRTVIVEEHGEGEVLVRLARVVPESEALGGLYGILSGKRPAASKAEERDGARAARVKKYTRPKG
jgi:hypothetical protein